MSIKTSLLTIISVVAVAAAATFTSFDAKKLDADSAGSLAAVAVTFPLFKETMLETASFPFSNADSAAAFLPWLFLLRLKRRLAQHLARKRNNPAPSKRRFLHQIVDGIGLGQTRLGIFARRFRGSIALFLATLLCVFPIQPTMTAQTVEFDESAQTVSVTFYDENLDANVHIAAISIVGAIFMVAALVTIASGVIWVHNQYDRSDVDGMVKARTSLETPTMYAWCNHFYAGKLAWENKMRKCSSCDLGNYQYWHRQSAVWIWFDDSWLEYGTAHWSPVAEVSGGDRYRAGWESDAENTHDEDPGEDWLWYNGEPITVTRWAFLIDIAYSGKHRIDGDHVVRSKISGTWPKWTGSKADLNLQTAGRNLNRTYPARLNFEYSPKVWNSVTHQWNRLSWKPAYRETRFRATDDDSKSWDIIDDNMVVRDEYVKGWSDLYWKVVKEPRTSTQTGDIHDNDGNPSGRTRTYKVYSWEYVPHLRQTYETDLD